MREGQDQGSDGGTKSARCTRGLASEVALGREIVGRVNELAAISEDGEHLTRIFLTAEHRAAAELILKWMREAGMGAHLDAIGNVCGRYEGASPGLPCLMLGSHYDTVRDAGKWDGPLGVITAIACVADLNRRGQRLPFPVFELPSGAGHDGMAMIDIADAGMIFVRCRGGISHHPDEHVELADAGAWVLLRLIENFRLRK